MGWKSKIFNKIQHFFCTKDMFFKEYIKNVMHKKKKKLQIIYFWLGFTKIIFFNLLMGVLFWKFGFYVNRFIKMAWWVISFPVFVSFLNSTYLLK